LALHSISLTFLRIGPTLLCVEDAFHKWTALSPGLFPFWPKVRPHRGWLSKWRTEGRSESTDQLMTFSIACLRHIVSWSAVLSFSCEHRVDRVLCFSPVVGLGLPHALPSPAGECDPPSFGWGVGGGIHSTHLLAGEGVGVPIPTREQTLLYSRYKCTLWLRGRHVCGSELVVFYRRQKNGRRSRRLPLISWSIMLATGANRRMEEPTSLFSTQLRGLVEEDTVWWGSVDEEGKRKVLGDLKGLCHKIIIFWKLTIIINRYFLYKRRFLHLKKCL
jgi:hypothetical protein